MGFNKKVAKKLQLGKMMNMQETTLDHQSVKTELSREILWISSPLKLEMLKIVRSIISLWWISGSMLVFEAWCDLVMKFKHTSTYRSNSGQIVQRPPTPKTSKTSYTKFLGFRLLWDLCST